MTAQHRVGGVPANKAVTMYREPVESDDDESDEELPPLLYYTTCIARNSDPTLWADERGSDYWLNHEARLTLPVGSVPPPVDHFSNITQHGWGQDTWAVQDGTGADFRPTLTYIRPDEYTPQMVAQRANGSGLPIPYEGWPGPRRAPVPVASPPEAPTAVIPVIQPGDNMTTQLLPLVRPPLVRPMFRIELNANPPDLEAILDRTISSPRGGST